MKLKWTPESLNDLLEIHRNIGIRRPQAANRVIRRIKASTLLLKEQPNMGRSGRIAGTREWVLSDLPFVIPYLVRDQQVVILRVLHDSRHWDLSDSVFRS